MRWTAFYDDIINCIGSSDKYTNWKFIQLVNSYIGSGRYADGQTFLIPSTISKHTLANKSLELDEHIVSTLIGMSLVHQSHVQEEKLGFQ